MNKIFVWTKRPGCMARHVWMSDSLENLQRYVGGYIETVTFGDMVVICDEEGRLKGKEHNCTINGVDFCGDIIVAGVKGEEIVDCPEIKPAELFK